MTDINPTPSWAAVRQLEIGEFALGGANGNMNEQAKSLAARSELLKQYAALPYESKTGGYALNERVQLATGDIVRSTIASNVNNPNVNMTGWEVSSLKPEKNLSDVPNKAAARSNLSVYSQTEVDTAIANATPTIPNATETVAGIAKIAPMVDTYLAIDDTQFVTPKKLLAGLKYHLNVTGTAPLYACRAWVNFNGTGTPTIKASGNVSSITDNGVGDYTLNFAAPMPNANYSISLGGAEASDGAPLILSLRMSGEAPLLKSTSAVRVSIKSPNSGVAYDTNNISVQVFC